MCPPLQPLRRAARALAGNRPPVTGGQSRSSGPPPRPEPPPDSPGNFARSPTHRPPPRGRPSRAAQRRQLPGAPPRPPPPSPLLRPGPSPTFPLRPTLRGALPARPRCHSVGLPGRERPGGRRGEDSSAPRPAPSLSPRCRRGAAAATPTRQRRGAPQGTGGGLARSQRAREHRLGGPERGGEGHREGN